MDLGSVKETTVEDVLHRLTSRKFWAFCVAVVTTIGALLVGDLTVPDFVKAIIAAAASYQITEGLVDAAARFGRQE
jgi:hypothetical protein